MNVCDELGVPIAENNTVGPSNIITFLGFIIDTVLMMVKAVINYVVFEAFPPVF
jgi:hypothetical protein